MKYYHNEIEKKWQKYWAENQTFKAENNSEKPKYYVLDMFPYPSGAGLHVGHPLGYIASDIYARYKRHKGFNVLHPQGYDSFGLPAEQYAIQTGQHPAKTTETNIKTYRKQLDRIGFSFDWSRELRTSNGDFYKYTQWIFTLLFNSYYCNIDNCAEPIEELIKELEHNGNEKVDSPCDEDTPQITAEDWKNFTETEKQEFLLKYRLTYLSETVVNWCPELGTVLANDEIVNGVSERGGHAVVQKKMKQWSMRITAYAQRLLDDLEGIDWPQPIKDIQTNWIGRSEGAHLTFKIQNSKFDISVFTTRPDTIFGVSFMTLAPEHELVSQITTTEQKEEVEAYIKATAKRSERDRMSDVKTISGCFTGAYAEHPFTKKAIPIYIGDYVLAGYGTGAVMAVPCGDQRDYDFAKHFNIEIPNIFENVDISEQAFEDKGSTKLINSDFISGLPYKKAFKTIIYEMEKQGIGYKKISYRLRDAVFSRQRYWGEPFPVYYKNGLPQMIDKKHLPILLPEVENYLPTSDGKPPLGNANTWAWDVEKCSVVSNQLVDGKTIFPLELNTMPGWAGSSWYFNRYMDAHNTEDFASAEALNYWQDVDLYIGGSEHATGHLLYSRFWQKFLYDLQLVPKKEYAKKLINQGMILGESAFVYVFTALYDLSVTDYIFGQDFSISEKTYNLFLNERYDEISLSKNIINLEKGFIKSCIDKRNVRKIHVYVKYVNKQNVLDVKGFLNFRSEYSTIKFIGESGKIINNQESIISNDKYIVGREVEKMSKSKYNVVNPDLICEEYGADALRLFEMFLGPLTQSKPWKTAGISGVYSFLKKLWKLYHTGKDGVFYVADSSPSGKLEGALKTLHKTIKKVDDDIANFSFNTSVSNFMICVNELTQQKCNQREILEPLLVLISPYAPHIAEELWSKLGHTTSISTAAYPVFDASHLVESNKTYPISFNGKMRFTLDLSLDLSKEEIEKAVLADERTQKQLDGRTPKKVIVVPGKIVNIVG